MDCTNDNKKIIDFNLEIEIFLSKLKIYQKETKIIDKHVIKNFKNLVTTIDKFVENPNKVSCGQTSLQIDFIKNGIEFKTECICKICNNKTFPKTFSSLKDHIQTSVHIKGIKKYNKKLRLLQKPKASKDLKMQSTDKEDNSVLETEISDEVEDEDEDEDETQTIDSENCDDDLKVEQAERPVERQQENGERQNKTEILQKQQIQYVQQIRQIDQMHQQQMHIRMQQQRSQFQQQSQFNDPMFQQHQQQLLIQQQQLVNHHHQQQASPFHQMILSYDQVPVFHNVPGMREARVDHQPIQRNYHFPVPTPNYRYNTVQVGGPFGSLINNGQNVNLVQQKPQLPQSLRQTPPKVIQNIPLFPLQSHLHGESQASLPSRQDLPIKAKLNQKILDLLNLSNIEIYVNELIVIGKKLMFSSSYTLIKNDLEEKLKTYYPKVKVYHFGSRVNGLGSNEGDLDIFIDVGDTYNGTTCDKSYMQRAIENTRKALSIKNSVWEQFSAVTAARTPILRAFNIKLGIDCDLSFSNGLSHCNTQLIKYFLELQPVCYKLAMFIKICGKNSGLETKMSSYSFILLVIFYLQKNNLLPSVRDLQADIEPFNIGSWQANFVEKSLRELKIEKCDDFLKHLIGFFDFYYNFQFTLYVVCPYLGYEVSKTSFEDIGNADPKLTRYTNYMKTIDLKNADPRDHLFASDSPMCIQDPFELVHNVVKGLKVIHVTKFTEFCYSSSQILKNLNDQN